MRKKDNVEALVPVGAGSFMNAEIKNDNKIVMRYWSRCCSNKKL